MSSEPESDTALTTLHVHRAQEGREESLAWLIAQIDTPIFVLGKGFYDLPRKIPIPTALSALRREQSQVNIQ